MLNLIGMRAFGVFAVVFTAGAPGGQVPVRPIDPLSPPVLHNQSRIPRTVEVTLTAAPALLSLMPGTKTDAYAYNGTVPGPTLEAREGDRVVVHFRNQLPEPTTVHWHGIHLPFEMDGSPFHPIQPGEQHDYAFTLMPGSAGTYWYHPHFAHSTGAQVAKGLYGALVVRAGDDPLPISITEQVLILSDSRLEPDGSIRMAEPGTPEWRVDFENGREGNLLFVNGRIMPTVELRSGEVQRWRIINASAARTYRIALAGHTFLHIGGDGGLFERPVEVKEILISSAERVELLVRGTGAPGERLVLRSLPYDRYIPQTKPGDWNQPRDLLAVHYSTDSPAAPIALPSTLRAVPALDTTASAVTRVISLTQGFINGRVMDMDRIDIDAALGATEIWEVENLVGMDHPFHLHGFQFQVIERNGIPEPFRQWKDTINVPKHESVRFVVRFSDYPGKWMFHCHILAHEEHGMMGILRVQ